jgi:hypothetical protein
MTVEPITAASNAIAETAKTAGNAVDLVRDLGAFVAKVLGDVPANLVGLGGDHIAHVRIRNEFGWRNGLMKSSWRAA